MTEHCCPQMRAQVEFACLQHEDPSQCADALIAYTPKFDEYGLRIHDGGSSVLAIRYCPWCGATLPKSRRDQWFEALRALGFDEPFEQEIPKGFESDAWYRR